MNKAKLELSLYDYLEEYYKVSEPIKMAEEMANSEPQERERLERKIEDLTQERDEMKNNISIIVESACRLSAGVRITSSHPYDDTRTLISPNAAAVAIAAYIGEGKVQKHNVCELGKIMGMEVTCKRYENFITAAVHLNCYVKPLVKAVYESGEAVKVKDLLELSDKINDEFDKIGFPKENYMEYAKEKLNAAPRVEMKKVTEEIKEYFDSVKSANIGEAIKNYVDIVLNSR